MPCLLAIGIILFFLLSGCQFGGQSDVEMVVSKGELNRHDFWSLSPGGDKIAYKSESHRTVVLFLRTNEKRFIDDDDCFDWFDDIILSCGRNLFITDNADDFTKILPKLVQFEQIDLPAVLSNAGKIYWQKGYPESVIILNSDYQQNLAENYEVQTIDVDDEDVKAILEGYNYKVVFDKSGRGDTEPTSKKIYSPDGNYYYLRNDSISTLTIYRVEDDEKIIEFYPKSSGQDFYNIVKPGWVWDSSGVYFQIISGGGPYGLGWKNKYHGIRKLKIPEEYLQPTLSPSP